MYVTSFLFFVKTRSICNVYRLINVVVVVVVVVSSYCYNIHCVPKTVYSNVHNVSMYFFVNSCINLVIELI